MKGFLYRITDQGKMTFSRELSESELSDVMFINPHENIIPGKKKVTCIAENRRISEKLADKAYLMCT